MKTATTTAIEKLEAVFKALADKTRLRILALLGDHEVCVCDIHEALGVPQPTASRHLAYLRRVRLVDARRDGLWMHYRVSSSLDPVVRRVVDATVHALSHVPTISRDRKHLQRCCGELPALQSEGSRPCCTPGR